MGDLEVFLRAWIDRSLFHLAIVAEPNGGLQYVLQPQGAEQIFNGVVFGGGIPYKLMEASSPPPGWFIGTCIKEGFSYYATPEEDLSGGKGWGKGKGKGKGKEKRPPNPIFADLPDGICRKYCVGQCDREDCKFAHDDNAKWQVEMKIAEQEAEKAASAAEQSGEGSEDAGEPSAKKARSEW